MSWKVISTVISNPLPSVDRSFAEDKQEWFSCLGNCDNLLCNFIGINWLPHITQNPNAYGLALWCLYMFSSLLFSKRYPSFTLFWYILFFWLLVNIADGDPKWYCIYCFRKCKVACRIIGKMKIKLLLHGTRLFIIPHKMSINVRHAKITWNPFPRFLTFC